MDLNNLPNLPEGGKLLIDKPSGLTSFGVVARVRRVLTQHFHCKVKVGHTGTLDPFATGLLVLVYGKETKNAMSLTKLDKVYEAEFTLGATSSTGDVEGEFTNNQVKHIPSHGEIIAALAKFTGKISQTPPAFSAIKIGGRRAYDFARRGETVQIPPRIVEVFRLELRSYSWPKLEVIAHVSSGTYIRTIAEDLGGSLQTGGYCSQLRRTKIADFDIDDAHSLADFGITS